MARRTMLDKPAGRLGVVVDFPSLESIRRGYVFEPFRLPRLGERR